MRVALVTPDLRPGGGVPEKALFVARSLRRQLGASVSVISLATSSVDDCSRLMRRPRTWLRPLQGSYRYDECTVEHHGAVAAEIEIARYHPRGRLRERLTGFDVVHVVAGTPAWAWAVRGFAGPIVVHFASFVRHERASQPAAWTPSSLWRRGMTSAVTAIERAALGRAQLIITVNDRRRREVEAIVGAHHPVETVHTGVDTDRFSPGPYREDGFLLCVGRLADPRKNLPLLLRAYAAACGSRSSFPRLVLAGHSGPSAEGAHLITELGLTQSVRYVGAADRAGLAALYRGASAFVLSSDEEGQGIVILEAMASGLPIVATSCVGPPEMVTHEREGLLVPVGSVDGLTAALVRICEDSALRRRLSTAVRARAVADFSLDTAGARLCHVYRAAGLVSESEGSRRALTSVPAAGIV